MEIENNWLMLFGYVDVFGTRLYSAKTSVLASSGASSFRRRLKNTQVGNLYYLRRRSESCFVT